MKRLNSLARRARTGALAVLSLGSLAATLGGVRAAPPDAKTTYREALARFRAGDLVRADQLLKRLPADRADVHNLRGAIHLRRRQWAAARREFAVAAARDPSLWEASYNLAETDFRQGRYTASRRRLEKLPADAPSRPERKFVEYKILLSDLLAGREEPARRFLAEADRRRERPAGYAYLRAALARQNRREAEAQGWLAQAKRDQGRTHSATRRLYAQAFRELDWTDATTAGEENVGNPEPTSVRRTPSARHPVVSSPDVTSARLAVVEVLASPSPPTPPIPDPGNDAVTTWPTPFPAPAPAVRHVVPGGVVPPPLAAVRTAATVTPDGPGEGGPTPAPLASRRTAAESKGRKEPAAVSASPSPAAEGGDPAQPANTPAAGKPLAEAPAEVRAKFESAQQLYEKRECPDALRLLDEIDTTQPGIAEVRNLRALAHYELAYRLYLQQNYPGALRELDEADEAQPVADTANLRGLVLARQRLFEQAEAAFRKAIAADPTLWAAKFNLADLPFSYRNFTEARRRFEALTAETDRTREPRQAELTEFKVFLTLLLEGRESAARSFMARFKANGNTPARPYAQAALDFHAGRFDRAIESIKEARRNYPPQLEAIFAESFYRVGWLTDATTLPAAVAASSAAPSPTPDSSSPVQLGGTAEAAATSTSPTPEPVSVASSPTPVSESTPVLTAVTPTPEPTLAASPGGMTPAAPATADVSPEPVPTAASGEAAEKPSPPSPDVTAVKTSSSRSAPEPPPAAEGKPAGSSFTNILVRKILPVLVGLYLVGTLAFAVRVFLARSQNLRRTRRAVPLPRYQTTAKVAESEKV